MIYVAKSADSWETCKPVIQEFLESPCDFLFIPESESISPEKFQLASLRFPEVDVIQFASLRFWQRGELGIGEFHWIFSEFLSVNKFIFLFSRLFLESKISSISKLAIRYESMQTRHSAVRAISKDFANFGIVIPHYIEPVNSTIFLSRAFAKALLEINESDELSMFRVIFALSRTANFSGLRISGFLK